MSTQWVRSKWNPKPTDEEKFKVARKRGSAYVIEMDGAEPDLWLPDSQYVPCDPPEQWERVEVEIAQRTGEYDGNNAYKYFDRAGNPVCVVLLVVERRKG